MKANAGPSQTREVADAAWLRRFARLVQAARGNDRFIPLRALAHLTRAWVEAQAISPSSVPLPRLTESGLPGWSSWLDLQAEQSVGASLGPSQEPAPPPLRAGVDVEGPQARLLRREWGARRLAEAPALPLVEAQVAIRRREGKGALVALVLDRQAADGTLVRLALDVVVKADNPDLRLEGDTATPSSALVDQLSLATALPAPAIAVQLAGLGGLTVLRLTRGVVGPVGIADVVPPALAPLISLKAGGQHRDGDGAADDAADGVDVDADVEAVLVLRLEELSTELPRTAENDLFDATGRFTAMMATLPTSLSALRGYCETRLVVSSSVAARARGLAETRGCQTVVTPWRRP